MQDSFSSKDDEINLSEIFAVIWAHKLLLFLITSVSVFIAGYISLTTEKRFTATAVFQIEQERTPGFTLPSEFGALASLAGIANGASSANTSSLLERLLGREFILGINTKYSLDKDPYFNAYNPAPNEPFWKASIKKIIGWESQKLNKDAVIENNVISKYKKIVEISETDGGAVSISVTHKNPTKASKYANAIMEETRQLIEKENKNSQQLRLSYLSETLADSLQEMERTQGKLKEYALKNSALAQENFISGSLKLDEIRMESLKAQEISKLLSILEKIVKKGILNNETYEELRSNNPLVDDIEFRRILGMSETISAWSWPEIETIEAVSATLRDRIKRLDVEIKNIENNAKIYATSADNLARFTRDAKIAEATYTVLIEQVKSQTLAAGFQPDTFKVFAYATPPLVPTSPKRNLLIALGALIGIFIGCALALIGSKIRGVYYTKISLLSEVNAQLSLKSKLLKKLSRKSVSKIIAFISKHKLVGLGETEIILANKKLVYIFNYGGKLNASDTARLFAAQSSQAGRNVIICDLTGQSEKDLKGKVEEQSNGLSIKSINENLSVMLLENRSTFFTSTKLDTIVEDLKNGFDQVFICSNEKEANLGLLALRQFNPSLILIAGLRTTRKMDIKNTITNQQIDLLIYD